MAFLADPALLSSIGSPTDDIINQSSHDFKAACNRRRSLWSQGYRTYLLGMLYHYFYKNYGKGIPDELDTFLDYRSIYHDSEHVFYDLEKWWSHGVGDRSIQDYTSHQNKILAQRSRVRFIQDSQQQMKWLANDNGLEHSNERLVRIIKGCDDNGNDLNERYDLGVKAINALLFWLTKYQGLAIKPPHQLYRKYKLKRGMNYMKGIPKIERIHLNKDDSFSITFRSEDVANAVVRSIRRYHYDTSYPYYRAKVDHISQYVQSKIQDTVRKAQEPGETINYSISVDYAKSPRSKSNILFYLQKIFDRYAKSIPKEQFDYNVHNFTVPCELSEIEQYWRGMKIGLRALDYEPVRLMQIYLDDPFMIGGMTNSWNQSYRDLRFTLEGGNNKSYYEIGLSNTIQIILTSISAALRSTDDLKVR